MGLDELQAEHDAAADAVAAFEQEWGAVDAEWREKRRQVNDRYRAAAAALEAEHVANADPNRPDAQSVVIGEPEG